MAQLSTLGHIRTMTKSKRITLLVTNVIMLLAGLYGMIGFVALTDLHSSYGYVAGSSHSLDEISATTNAVRLQTIGSIATDHWQLYTLLLDRCRWNFLAVGSIFVVGCIIHLWLTPVRSKD